MEASNVPQDTPMGVTYDDALRAVATDPVALGLTPDADEKTVEAARDRAARNLMAGAMANAVYWGSRPELEQLRALHEGHGIIGTPPEAEGDTAAVTPTESAGSIDSTAEEVPATALEGGAAATPPANATVVEPSANEADKLRAQLRAAGIEPEA